MWNAYDFTIILGLQFGGSTRMVVIQVVIKPHIFIIILILSIPTAPFPPLS